MARNSVAQELVADCLKRFPKAPSKTLGRKLFRENPKVWTTENAAYAAVRRARGNAGRKNRKHSKSTDHFRPNGKAGVDLFGSLPEGLKDYDDWRPLVVNGPCRALVLCDAHVPYHDRVALARALDEGRKEGVDLIILLGDFSDFYSVSRWEKDPRKRDFAAELETVQEVLGVVRRAFPRARIIYKDGNHEERMLRYMTLKAPELLNLDIHTTPQLLGLEGFEIEHVGDCRPIKLGKLNLIHGHEYRSISSAVNAARGLYLKTHAHTLCGHYHQASQHSEADINGHTVSTFSVGCLCDLRPEYLPYNKWVHGFAIVDVDSDGAFSVKNRRIIDGQAW